jgi:formylglycine-generating enzyme required for sulfatase activity/serine/threonine protein kinase
MEASDFREVLCADVALALGVLDAAAAAAALATGVLQAVPEAHRCRVATEVERLIAEAKGDARAALLNRGVDRAIQASLKPETSHALAESGARVRAPLRPLDNDRYVGFLPIGEGGMGVVYLALDTELNRRVAFKMIRTGLRTPLEPTPSVPDDELMTRFLQEAWITGALEHPGVVPVHELGKTPSGVPYYTMRLVRGERTLDDAIGEAKTLEQRLALLEPFLKVCDAVRYAHSRGVVHRDLKPANVALGEYGEVVVLDWGLARVEDLPDLAESHWRSRISSLRQETDMRTLTSALGTPGYMAPEAVLGQVRQVDARSDVYSLGAILYRILAGKLPFDMTSFPRYAADVMKGVEGVPGAPSGLEPICLKALAKSHEDRYADADELATAIRKWQAESAVEREVRTLANEAEATMGGAKDLHGEALLSRLDRVLAISARILELRPEHPEATRIRAQALKARDGAIAERERLARKRQLKRVGVVGLAAAVAVAAVVAFLLDAERRKAEEARAETQAALQRETAAREEATTERDAKGKALDEKARALDQVLRLADSKKVNDLVKESDTLWPAHPDGAPAMAAWLERARAVLKNREGHEAGLRAVRERALPYAEADRLRDHAQEIERIGTLKTGIETRRKEREAADTDEKRKAIDERLAAAETEAKKLEATVQERASWAFATAEEDWRHQVLTDVLQGLETLEKALEQVRKRREFASTLRAKSIDEHRAEWDATVAAVAASPKYGGLKLAPQLGLVPLGPDPASGLFEFAHVGSGELPTRDATTNRLALTDDSAIVLVLVPGGKFRMGAQKSDPTAPSFDPMADGDEGPVHEVTLSPHFVGKHEVTQAQWQTMAGARPSLYSDWNRFGGKQVTLRHPVEQVSWVDCARWLSRWNLGLPTEAQWEHACRSGTDTPWWCGREAKGLERIGNVADAFSKANGGAPHWTYEEWNDGYTVHAPVGSFAANAFGLHDVHGNVWELCSDRYEGYANQTVTLHRISRGGGWVGVASDARSASRAWVDPSFRSYDLGVRPARDVTSE